LRHLNGGEEEKKTETELRLAGYQLLPFYASIPQASEDAEAVLYPCRYMIFDVRDLACRERHGT
jgi:hypothetical protein